MSTTMYI